MTQTTYHVTVHNLADTEYQVSFPTMVTLDTVLDKVADYVLEEHKGFTATRMNALLDPDRVTIAPTPILSKADLAVWVAENMHPTISDLEAALAHYLLEDFNNDEAFYKEQLEQYTEIISEE